MKKILIFIAIVLVSSVLQAQKERQLIREGNKFYEEGKFSEAEISYQKATDVNPVSDKATYNLGNARYQQNNYEDATNHFKRAAEMSMNPKIEAKALYNAGNSLMSQEKYDESIPLFKQALRLNPDDADARYNLAYAQWKLKQQQQQDQQNKDQNKDQDKDQKEDQQKQDQEKDQKNDQQDKKEQDQQKQDQKQDQQQNPQQLSKEEAERMLQALTGEEKKTLEKLNEKKVKAASRVSKEKDW